MTKITASMAGLMQQFTQKTDFFVPDKLSVTTSLYGFQGKPGSKFLTTKELAAELKISVKKLERMRNDGSGPPFIRVGKNQIRYLKICLDAWVKEQLENAPCDAAEVPQYAITTD